MLQLQNRPAAFAAIAASLLHLALGLTVIPLAGPQQDETLFTRGILPPVYVHSASHRNPEVAFMLMPYIGALKIWLYKPIFALAGASIWTLRIPVVTLGALAVWLTFIAARRFIPPWWAASAALLVAADPIFVWTGTLDWGPVALQHALALAMVCSLIRLHDSGDWRWALGAGLACGLGVWDKISFLWIVAALAAGLAASGGADVVRRWLRPRVAAALAFGILAGAAVFIRFNLRSGFESFRSSAGLEWDLPKKLLGLWVSLDGSALFGFIVNDSGRGGLPGWSLLPAALLAGVLIGLSARSVYRVTAFLSAAFAAGFLFMAVMKNAGMSCHHIVLLWPLPHLLVATGAAALWEGGWPRRAAAILLPGLVFVPGLLVHGRYLDLARTEGAARQWTQTSGALAADLESRRPGAVFVVDWGILDPLRLLSGGRLPLIPASDAVVSEIEQRPGDVRLMKLKEPSTLIVTRPQESMLFPGLNERLDQWAAEQGLEREPVSRIQDAKGVTQFVVYRYAARRP